MRQTKNAGFPLYAGLFMVTLSTLMFETLLTRIFSVTMWYHFAFVAISVAMFGMTAGALTVYLLPAIFTPENALRHLYRSALLFSVSIVVCFLTHLAIPFVVHRSLVGLYSVCLNYLVISVPFFWSGICVSIALTKIPGRVSTLYAADLAGAGLGCIALLYALAVTDGPTAVIVAAALAGAGAIFFARAAGNARRTGLAAVITAGIAVFAVGNTIAAHSQHSLLRPLWVKGGIEPKPRFEKWNSFSRIGVWGSTDTDVAPFGWGLSDACPSDRKIRQLELTIDATAMTVLTGFGGDTADLGHLKYDVTNLVHWIRPAAKTAIVGVGGGRDILSALAFGQKEIVGVEINGNIISLLKKTFAEFTGHIDRMPQVRLVNDEARSYIARSKESYDIIQVSLIDTWAATASGAYVFTENSLYTVEAWKIFLNHLSKNGVMTFSRWYYRGDPEEMYRLTALAAEALMREGISDPRRHLMVVRHMPAVPDAGMPYGVGTLLASREPFSEADVRTVGEVAARMRFDLVLSPAVSLTPVFERIASGRDLASFTASYPINITPPTDDRPFFFHMLKFGTFFNRQFLNKGGMSFNVQAVTLLGALLLLVFVLSLLCIAVPLLLTRKNAALAGAWPYFIYFAAIGFAFMLVEISQLQRLIVFLGHPSYSLSVVLFSLLLSSGIGSLVTGRAADTGLSRRVVVIFAALIAVTAFFGTLTPHLIHSLQAASTGVRVAAAVAALLPLGFFMGMAFPLGMKAASAGNSSITPWLWGINGAMSVVASVLAIVIAMTAGISATFWSGFACYAVAFAAYVWSQRKGRPAPGGRG